MDAIKLVKKGTDEVVAYACGKCGLVATVESVAEQCCDRRCRDCGGTTQIGFIYCKACWDKRLEQRRLEQYNKATRIPASEYKGPVYVDETDKYYEDLASMRDDYDDGLIEKPRYVYTVDERSFHLPTAESLVETEMENGEWADGIDADDVEGLQEMLDKWNARQTSIGWFPDFTRALVGHGKRELAA